MKKRFIIILIIICMVLVCIFGGIYYYYTNSVKNRDVLYEYNEFADKNYTQERKEMLKPSGIFILNREYKGDNDLDDFYRELKELAEENKEKIGVKKVSMDTVKVSIDTDSFKEVAGGIEFKFSMINIETNESIDYTAKLYNAVSHNFVEFKEVQK